MPKGELDPNSALARLLAALHPGDPHTDRVISASDAGVLEIVDEARAHRASPLLARALDRGGRLDAILGPARERLRGDVLDAAMDRARLEGALAAAADALAARSVSFLALKGVALGLAVYAEPLLRPMTDVDLLVHPCDLDRALDALEEAGFEPPAEAERRFWRESYYNLPVRAPEGGALVEMHWSIAQETRQRPDIGGLFARSRAAEWKGRELRVLGAADLVLHQSLHLSYHYFEPKLLWLHDLALVHGAEFDPEEVLARARAWGMSTPLHLATLQLERAFPGAAQPRLLEAANESSRVRALVRIFAARRRPDIVAWRGRRWVQLVLAALMLDKPAYVAAPLASWLLRAVRHGDRGVRRRTNRGGPR